ncbi:MAG: YbaY family lipoprotein [Alcanivorax sp.]|uniref:YbaY family lipoprotein n=1 Tax=Alcanivorax sp. TaxID=1872427 RepID=UPI003DA70A4B
MRPLTSTLRSLPVLLGSAGVVALLALSGCDQGKPESDSEQPTVAQQSEKTEQQILSGKVMYRERMAMPKGATLTVTLEDVSLADAPSTVIAEQHIDDPGQVPVPFTLRYASEAVVHDHPMAYAVRAEIRGADGQLLWLTTERHTAELGERASGEEITVMLQRVAAEQSGDTQPKTGMAGAKEAGASFWAVGNEPGWNLAIYPEEKLVFVGDYGETTVTTADTGAQTEGTETIYMANTDTDQLKVEISETPCEDTMSGEAFDYQVKVTSNETLYSGCGRDL